MGAGDTKTGEITFGLWKVHPELRKIEGPSGTVRVKPKAMEVLVALLRRPGQLWPRSELLAEVWKDTFVGDEVLTQSVVELRRAFGDDPRNPATIETVRAGGYRLLIAPDAIQTFGSAPSGEPQLTPDQRVAVFSFRYRGSERTAHLGEAMARLVSTDLHGSHLRVVDPSLVRRAAGVENPVTDPRAASEIAARLDAGVFVLGNIIEAGGRLRAMACLCDSAGLVKGSADAEIDTEAQLFELSTELARQLLSAQLGVRSDLSSKARDATRSITALREFYDGELHFRAARVGRAIDAFRRSTAADPEFVIAWVRLAFAAAWVGQTELSEHATNEASRLAGRLQEPEETLLAGLRAVLEGDAAVAEEKYRDLLQIYPENPEGWLGLGSVLFVMNPLRGRSMTEARDAFEHVVALAPHHLAVLMPLAYLAARDRRWEDHAELVERLGPDHDFRPFMLLVSGVGQRGATDEQLTGLEVLPDHAIQEAVRYVALLTGDLRAAAKIARLLTKPWRRAEVRATGHLLLANLELARGRLAVAKDQLGCARDLDPQSALEHAALFAALPFLPREHTDLQSLRFELERWQRRGPTTNPPRPRTPFALHDGIRFEVREYLRGLLSARMADEEAALESAGKLEEETRHEPPGPLVRDLARGIRSYLAQEQGRLDQALAHLESCELRRPLREMLIQSPFQSSFLERYRRGELLAALGRHEEAMVWLEMITEASPYGLLYAAPAHRLLAGIYKELGLSGKRARVLRAATAFGGSRT